MRRRRTIALFLAALLAAAAAVFALPGCGEDDGEEQSDLTVVGFSQVGAESEWRVANTENMKAELSERNGFELIYNDAQQQQENQIRAIRRFIQQKVDYIVLAPITETGWESVLEEAREAGVKVILVDRMITVEDDTLYTAYVGSDFRREGDRAVAWLEELLKKQGRASKRISIVDIQGTIGSSPQVGRTGAIEDGVARHENWVMTAQECGDFTRSKGYEVMSEILKKTRDIDVVYCENDSSAFGVIDALEENGIRCGADGVIVLSFDATRMGLTMCLEGKISYVGECNALQGPYVADILDRLRGGELVEKIEYVEETEFDCFTITQEMIDERTY